MSKKTEVQLTVGNDFWTPEGLGAVGMQPIEAISELVANSIDWIPSSKRKGKIKIIVSSSEIQIVDNGIGMNLKELETAISLAKASNEIRKPIKARKGMYGMGLKVACLSLGWDIHIFTRQHGEEELLLSFDARKFKSDQSKQQVPIYFSPSGSPLLKYGFSEGTAIVLRDLTCGKLRHDVIIEIISEAFAPDIKTGEVEIEVIYEDTGPIICKAKEQKLIMRTDLRDIIIELENGTKCEIRGFVGLMETGAQGSGKWGLNLFKENQLIERLHKVAQRDGGLFPFNIHPKHGKIYGEIYLDFCRPSFHKVGFDYETKEWRDTQKALQNILGQYQKESGDFRKNKDSNNERRKIQQRIDGATISIREKMEQASKSSGGEEIISEAPNDAFKLPNDDWFRVEIKKPKEENPFDIGCPWTWDAEGNELVVFLNPAHPAYKFVLDSPNEVAFQIYTECAVMSCVKNYLIEEKNYSHADSELFAFNYFSWLFEGRKNK